jgi:endonuclease III
VGKNYCRPSNPSCQECSLRDVCKHDRAD